MRNITVSNLEACTLCEGVDADELTSKIYYHVIPVNHDPMDVDEQSQQQFPHQGHWRAKDCLLPYQQHNVCSACKEFLLCADNPKKA